MDLSFCSCSLKLNTAKTFKVKDKQTKGSWLNTGRKGIQDDFHEIVWVYKSYAFGLQNHSFQASKAMVSESKSIAPGSVLRPPLLQLAQDAPLTAWTNVIEPLAVITHPPIRTRLHTF